jgi:urea transporter
MNSTLVIWTVALYLNSTNVNIISVILSTFVSHLLAHLFSHVCSLGVTMPLYIVLLCDMWTLVHQGCDFSFSKLDWVDSL